MKLIFFGFLFVALAASEQQYLPPIAEALQTEYLPPVEAEAEAVQVQSEPSNQYLAPVEAVEPIEQIAEDGYRYKTVKRIRYRNRRDVSELASQEYLPPTVEDSYGPPPSGPVVVEAPVEQSAVLADDGYRYKTVRRIRYRRRRDVSELPASEYLPPTQEDDSYSYPAPAPIASEIPVEAAAPVEIAAPVEVQETAQLADDGYRYKTVRRIRYRHRRDVSELAPEYLPPVQTEDSYSYPAPVAVEAPVEVPAAVEIPAPVPETAELADDGYRYKTVRRIRYRHRRDVSELAPEYLPPVQAVAAEAPIVQEAPVTPIETVASAPIEQSAVLADDGYRYKTVRRIRYRHRRDVSELAPEYLPPVQADDSYSYPAPVEVAAEAPIVQEAAVTPIETVASAPIEQSAALADDGYRYKTVRRIRYRHRRDVSELPSDEYLPPAKADDSYSYPAPAPVEDAALIEASAPVQETAELADDGYRYKTVKKYKIKRH